MDQPQRILVRGPNWTGDLIMATPAFRALRAGFPQAHITVHLREALRPLLDGAPWFDALRPLGDSARSGLGFAREAAALRAAGRFDLGLCLPDSFSAALLMRAAGVRQVVGYRRGGRRLLLHRAVAPPPGAGRRMWIARERHVLGLLAALGVPARGTHLELFTTSAEEREAAARLGEADPRPIVLLAPGASYGPSKLWPAGSFAAVGDALAAAGARVALIGTPAERGLTARVGEAMWAPALDLAGAISLGALKAVVRRARLLVCNDAGARHVAVAFGVPSVVLMGPTALEKTDMNLERVVVLSTDVDCRPCYRRRCPIDHRCMTRIAPDEVTAAALPALAADAAQRWRGGRVVAGGWAA